MPVLNLTVAVALGASGLAPADACRRWAGALRASGAWASGLEEATCTAFADPGSPWGAWAVTNGRRDGRFCGAGVDPRAEASDLAYANCHPEVVYLPGTRCSGVLVAPDVVLTAAHCLGSPVVRLGDASQAEREAWWTLTAGLEPGAVPPGPMPTRRLVGIVEAERHPDPAVDLALLRLSGAPGLAPTPWRLEGETAPPAGRVDGDRALRVAGFGFTERRPDGELAWAPVRATAWACAVGPGGRCRGPERVITRGYGGGADRAGPTAAESVDRVVEPGPATVSGACPGDSGGGLYEWVGDPGGEGFWRLVGIVSRSAGVGPCGSDRPTLHERVDPHASWILAFIHP